MNPWEAMQPPVGGQLATPIAKKPLTPQEYLQQLLQGATPGAQAARTADATSPASEFDMRASRAPSSGLTEASPQDPTSYVDPPAAPAPEQAASLSPFQLKSISTKITNHNPLATPEDRGSLSNMMALEQGDVDKLRGMADAEEAKPNQTNLSPIASLVDSWYGTNLQKGYTPPASPEEKAKHLAGLRQLAAQGQQSVTKDQLSLLLGSDKSESNLMKAVLAASLKGKQGDPDWRTDRNINSAVHDVHYAPNLKVYADLQNRLAGAYSLASGASPANQQIKEALQAMSSAVNRANVSSDYKQKQLDLPTITGYLADLEAMSTSDPYKPAPPQVVKYVREMSQRIFDVIQNDLAREATRVTAGKHFKSKEVQSAVDEARNTYINGDYSNDIRAMNGMPESQYKTVIGGTDVKTGQKAKIPAAAAAAPAAAESQPKYEYSQKLNKTRITYPDGRTEMKDGHLGQ